MIFIAHLALFSKLYLKDKQTEKQPLSYWLFNLQKWILLILRGFYFHKFPLCE